MSPPARQRFCPIPIEVFRGTKDCPKTRQIPAETLRPGGERQAIVWCQQGPQIFLLPAAHSR